MNLNNPIFCGAENEIFHGDGIISQLFLALIFVIIVILYTAAVFYSNRHHKKWPISRSLYWIMGVMSMTFSIIGPLANQAHDDFKAHMLGHLLLGMLAPLLMVLAAPMTLLLRTLNVSSARRLSSILKRKYFRFIMDPFIISTLHVGGLWLLYTTDLYSLMHHHSLLYVLIHIHVFLAGYFFVLSIIYIDPIPHRTNFYYRSVLLLIAYTFHGILSKYIYAHPPKGVPATQAEIGGIIMYYGGDLIELMMISILCFQWFKAARPRGKSSSGIEKSIKSPV